MDCVFNVIWQLEFLPFAKWMQLTCRSTTLKLNTYMAATEMIYFVRL
jgi:hypothetical protein